MPIPLMPQGFFQFAYVVRTLEGGMRTMRERFGVTRWHVRELAPAAPARRLAFAYVEAAMIELVEAKPDEDSIYRAWIPESDDRLRIHHLGYLIDDEAEYAARVAGFAEAGIATAMAGITPALHYHYADTLALLGHYVELVRLTGDEGRAYWADVPHN